ncbi:MAG: riboflavin kinase [Candidatus Gracilibacteria bacterium]|nr:riboflavin kinase [Candidatus Gracilibacteria bacterium]
MYQIIKGTVIRGKTLGSKIGFPTANIDLDNKDIEDGTYKLNLIIDGNIYAGAGVYLKEKGLFEAHFFGFASDIYGKEIEIVLLYKIRENKKFDSLEELKNQIQKDVDFAKSNTDYIVTFGTFDIVHPGHEFYLNNAKKYGDKLITIIARDGNVEKLKNTTPLHDELTRLENIKKLGVSDIVLLGDLDDPLKVIKQYKPKVVCLGYDQVGFIELLNKYIKENNLETHIIRLSPYKENIYKSSILKQKRDLKK